MGKCVNVLHTCTHLDEGSSVTCQVARAIRSFADKLFRSSEAEADNQPMWTCCRLFRLRGSQPSNLWFIRIQSRPRIREEALLRERSLKSSFPFFIIYNVSWIPSIEWSAMSATRLSAFFNITSLLQPGACSASMSKVRILSMSEGEETNHSNSSHSAPGIYSSRQ